MDVVFAVTTAVVSLPNGSRYTVRGGTHWLADDPVVLAQPSLFSEDASIGLNYSTRSHGADERPVETATAAPGERRNRPGPVPGPGQRRG